MKEIKKKQLNREEDDLVAAINGSTAWVLVTVANNSDGKTSTMSIRESERNGIIHMVATLLEQPEIFDMVQKQIAENLLNKNKEKSSPNTNIN